MRLFYFSDSSMVWGWLIIPVLALSMSVGGPLPIVGGVHDTTTLGDGIARLSGTTWGRVDGGRTVIVGHGDRAFAELHTLHIGDEIALFMGDYDAIRFEVAAMYWVEPGDESILTQPTKDYELVLITCSSDESHRLIVRARPVERN